MLHMTLCPPAALLGHWAEVWTLCEALWGRLGPSDVEADAEMPSQYEQQLARRRSFSAWLSSGATHRVEEEVSVAGKGCHTDAIFSYLTGNRISEACRLAQKEGEFSRTCRARTTDEPPPERALRNRHRPMWFFRVNADYY